MPAIDYSRNLLTAGFDASAMDLAEAHGGARITGGLTAEVARGVDLDLQIGAFADLDAAFRRYVNAELTGDAQASARLTGQLQVPINLFDEAGVAVRLTAAAEASAGVQLGLGLAIGDFIALVENQRGMQGLPSRLFRIFMEEIDVGGGVYAKAAISAMAYAHLVFAGRLVETVKGGVTFDPGFEVAAEWGVGLKAGAGFRCYLNMGLKEPRRLVRRTVDVLVDELIHHIDRRLPADEQEVRTLLDLLRVPLKVSFREAYEIGELITERLKVGALTSSQAEADQLALRAVQVLLEEVQRYVLRKAAEVGVEILRELLELSDVSAAEWAALEPQRRGLAGVLQAFPTEPFEPTDANRRYWQELVSAATDLGLGIAAAANPEQWTRPSAVIWSATELALAAAERVANVRATLDFLAVDPLATHAAFSGPATVQPPSAEVRRLINQTLGRAPDATLEQVNLVAFLVDDVVMGPLRTRSPEVDRLFDLFEQRVAAAQPSGAPPIEELLMSSLGAFVFSGGQPSPVATLRVLSDALEQFVEQQLRETVVPLVSDRLGDDPTDRRYFDEVCLPTLSFTLDTVFGGIDRWTAGRLPDRAFQEALSAVLMMLFGRTVVVAGDSLLSHVGRETQAMFDEAATHAGAPGGLAELLRPATGGSTEEVVEIVQEALRLGGEVFGPLPESTRDRLRHLLYEILEPLPLSDPGGLGDQLADQFFIPSRGAAEALAGELMGVAATHFRTFVERLLLRAVELALEEMEEIVEALGRQVEEWLEALGEALEAVRRMLLELAAEIARLVAEVEQRFAEAAAAFDRLTTRLVGSATRGRLLDELVSLTVSQAAPLLLENPVFGALPAEAKSEARSLMADGARLVLGPIVDLVEGTVADLAPEFDSLLTDIRQLDPDDDLVLQVGNLVLNRIQDGLTALFGDDDPAIELEFPIRFKADTPFGRIDVEETIDLGTIPLPIGDLLATVRAALEGLSIVESAVRSLAEGVASALAAELELDERQAERRTAEEHETAMARELVEAEHHSPGIAVLSPAPGSAVDGASELVIDLVDVPLSHLGLGENQAPRLHVWLNQRPLAIDAFEIEERRAAVDASGSTRVDRWPHFAPGAAVAPWGESERAPALDEARATEAVALGAGVLARPSAGLGGESISVRGDRPANTEALAVLRRREGGLSKPPSPQPDRRTKSKSRSRAGSLGRKRRGRGRGSERRPVSGDRGTGLSGRAPTSTEIADLLAPAPPGLTLRRRLEPEELERGVNTLVVAVVERRDQRTEEALSFLVAELETATAGERPVRLPTRPPADGKRPTRGKPQPVEGKTFWTPKEKRDKARRAMGEKLLAAQKPVDPRSLVKPRPARVWSAEPPYGAIELEPGAVVRARLIESDGERCLFDIGPGKTASCTHKTLARAKVAAQSLKPGSRLPMRVSRILKDGSISLAPPRQPAEPGKRQPPSKRRDSGRAPQFAIRPSERGVEADDLLGAAKGSAGKTRSQPRVKRSPKKGKDS